MGRAEVIKNLEVPPEATLYEAEADIENCFYQCGIPEEWTEFLTFCDTLSSSEVRQLGLTHFMDGSSISLDDK
eukprot:303129-Karenia_brevis.AAC.1